MTPQTSDKYQKALGVVLKEISRAKLKHGDKDFNSIHEGYAVLLEEVDEVWDEVKKDNVFKSVKEAVQVAAMAIRYVAELGDPEFLDSHFEQYFGRTTQVQHWISEEDAKISKSFEDKHTDCEAALLKTAKAALKI